MFKFHRVPGSSAAFHSGSPVNLGSEPRAVRNRRSESPRGKGENKKGKDSMREKLIEHGS